MKYINKFLKEEEEKEEKGFMKFDFIKLDEFDEFNEFGEFDKKINEMFEIRNVNDMKTFLIENLVNIDDKPMSKSVEEKSRILLWIDDNFIKNIKFFNVVIIMKEFQKIFKNLNFLDLVKFGLQKYSKEEANVMTNIYALIIEINKNQKIFNESMFELKHKKTIELIFEACFGYGFMGINTGDICFLQNYFAALTFLNKSKKLNMRTNISNKTIESCIKKALNIDVRKKIYDYPLYYLISYIVDKIQLTLYSSLYTFIKNHVPLGCCRSN